MTWTKAPDHKIVDGELVALTQSEKDRINAERERSSLAEEKRKGIENEAVSRAQGILSNYDSAEKLEDLLDEWEHLQHVVSSGDPLDKVRKVAEDRVNGVGALDGLSVSELKDVDPNLDDPFTNVSGVNPSTWRV